MKVPNIKTRQAILRPLRMSDAEAVAKYARNKKVSRWTQNIPYPYAKKDAREFIQKCVKEYRKKSPRSLRFAIDYGRKLVGVVGLKEIERGHRAEIGYWLAEPFWGRGITTEAVKKITVFGFKKFGLRRIRAGVFKQNIASQKVLERAGFTREGLQRKNVKKGNKFYDTWLFAKVR